MTTYRDTLFDVMKICAESSDYSRRIQKIYDITMRAAGLTESQRAERHMKALMRSETFKENVRSKGQSVAVKVIAEQVLEDTGEVRQRIKIKTAETYV